MEVNYLIRSRVIFDKELQEILILGPDYFPRPTGAEENGF